MLFELGVENYYTHIIIGVIFRIIFLLYLQKLQKIQVLDFVIYPSKTIKIIKSKL